jgi:pimeloyl-ACP methyl ester carboxylesterase
MGHRGVDLGGFSVTPTPARPFRVIAPDTRRRGRTAHPGGSTPYARLADDVVGLVDALGLDRPMICGFDDGAMTARRSSASGIPGRCGPS